MFCPQCGSESNAEGQHYCRSCGTNLKVVGKAVTLGDAIARSDGIPAKLKDIFNNIKIEGVTNDVARALDTMKTEIAHTSAGHRKWMLRKEREEFRHALRLRRKEKTAEQRRERLLTKGAIKFFWGGGLSIFLYFLFHALELKIPEDVAAKTPFAIEPVVRILWTIGFIPMLSGVGHVIAGLSIKRGDSAAEIPSQIQPPLQIDPQPTNVPRYDPMATVVTPKETPASVTERTTNILDHDPWRQRGAG